MIQDHSALSHRGWKPGRFLAGQAMILGVLAGLGAYRSHQFLAEAALPPFREEPLELQPLYDYDIVVSDEQLQRVLTRLRPRLYGPATSINHIDHALRFWTLDAHFDEPGMPSGGEMRRILMDHNAFAGLLGPEVEPLLSDETTGVKVRVQEGLATSSHADHALASLAEVGTPLDHPLTTATRKWTFRAMLEQSLRDFSLNQAEYEWSVLAYALLLDRPTRWRTTEGQEISFDRLAQRLMREQLPNGVCLGCHRLYTLAVLLRVDETAPILSPTMRQTVKAFLNEVTARLVQHQHIDGFWNGRYPDAAPASREPTDFDGDRLEERLVVTGHMLEWWAMAPTELHPPRSVLSSAGQWLVRTVDQLTDEEVRRYYPGLTHVGRSLALWRGRLPSEVPLAGATAEPPSARAAADAGRSAALPPTAGTKD